MNRPQEKDYTSHVAYCRALEDYCDAKPSMTHRKLIEQMLEALDDSVDDSREVYSQHMESYRDKYRPARAEAMRKTISDGDAAITAAREWLAQPEQSEPNNDEVICTNCTTQFCAIPVNVQRLMLDAGFELPFSAPPLWEPNYEELLGAIARGWCTSVNEKKVMDSDLAIAIAEEVVKYLAAARKAP